jgi:hypothetical protein
MVVEHAVRSIGKEVMLLNCSLIDLLQVDSLGDGALHLLPASQGVNPDEWLEIVLWMLGGVLVHSLRPCVAAREAFCARGQ